MMISTTTIAGAIKTSQKFKCALLIVSASQSSLFADVELLIFV